MDNTALFQLSYGLYVVGVQTEHRLGGCIVDALMQATSDSPPLLILSSMKNNLTNTSIKRYGAFTVSVLPEQVDPFVIANFGFQTARKVEKWANVPHRLVDGLPVLRDAAAYLRCKLVDYRELSTHTAFTCEVTDAWRGEGEPLIYGDYQKSMKQAAMAAFQAFQAKDAPPARKTQKKWVCTLCGYVYDGDVPFEALPEDWRCPRCGAPKSLFELQ